MTARDDDRDDRRDLNTASTDDLEMDYTDLPIAQAQSADDINPTLHGARRSYLRRALDQIDASRSSTDPVRHRRRWLEHLEARAEQAEQWARSEQESLQRAVEAMQRREAAERAARNAQNEARRVRGADNAERERLRRNERQRATYARKRAEGWTRGDTRAGMHATAIAVDPDAYATVKVDAYRRGSSIPVVLGEILTTTTLPPPDSTDGPRWRRTREGRRANQHTRIAIDDDTWHRLHHDALTARTTFARHLGRLIEHWADNPPDGGGG